MAVSISSALAKKTSYLRQILLLSLPVAAE